MLVEVADSHNPQTDDTEWQDVRAPAPGVRLLGGLNLICPAKQRNNVATSVIRWPANNRKVVAHQRFAAIHCAHAQA